MDAARRWPPANGETRDKLPRKPLRLAGPSSLVLTDISCRARTIFQNEHLYYFYIQCFVCVEKADPFMKIEVRSGDILWKALTYFRRGIRIDGLKNVSS